ncbi:MAG TPA: hypothetical protein PK313_05490, partial [Myxococcota bacterium]|nr:hypothetical protein [Myxococcota bacterium]
MSKLSVVLFVVVSMGFAVGCAKKATQDDLNKVCAHMVELQKAENPEPAAEDPIAKVTEDFAKKAADLETAKADGLAKLAEECTAAAAT